MQVNEEPYNACLENISALPAEAVIHDNVPLAVSTAEAAQLSSVASQDRSMLLSSGIAVELLDQLPIRAGAYLYAAARYVLFTDQDSEVVRQWKALFPRGFELVRYLKRFFSFAYRDDPELSAALSRIRLGNGYKDMLLDLLTLHLLAVEHPEPLDAIPVFDKASVQEALSLHRQLSDLYARVNTESDETTTARNIMHRAYTYYKQVADEVKTHGRFLFEGTPRRAAYIRAYRSNAARSFARFDPSEGYAPKVDLETSDVADSTAA